MLDSRSDVPGGEEIHPIVRGIISNIVSKSFGLTKAEVSGLSDEDRSRMMLSSFSEEEIDRRIEEEVSRFVAPFKAIAYRLVPGLEQEMERPDSEPFFNPPFDFSDIIFIPLWYFTTLFFITNIGYHCYLSVKWLLIKVLPSSEHGPARLTNSAAQQERQTLSRRCLTLSKSNYSRTSNLKGLKGVVEAYIQETNTGFRQEVEQHQEGTSRAVVPSR